MINKEIKTALLICLLLRNSNQKKALLTTTQFKLISQNENFSPRYFISVKEASEELGIAIHPLNLGGYLLVDIQKIATGSTLKPNEYINELQEQDTSYLWNLLQKTAALDKKNKVATNTEAIKKSKIEALFYHLIELAETNQTSTYKQICETDSLDFSHHRQLDLPLNAIEKLCLEKQLPNLTVLVTKANTGLPKQFQATEHERWDFLKQQVFECDWTSMIEEIDFDHY